MDQLEEKQIVFLVCAGRAGSGFLHSLLDSHPEILMLPMELKFHATWCRLDCDNVESIDDMVEKWCGNSKLVRFREGIHSDRRNDKFTNCEFERFRTKLSLCLKNRSLERHQVFYAIHEAYALAIGQNIDRIKTIVEWPADPSWLENSFEDFPDARIINVTRDFRANYASLKQTYLNTRRSLVDYGSKNFVGKMALVKIIKSLYQDARKIAFLPQKLEEKNFLTVRLEDLHMDLENSVRVVARWLGIRYQESLLQSTLGGKAWLGNSSYKVKVAGVDKRILTRWKSKLSKSEVIIIEYIFQDMLRKYEYSLTQSNQIAKKWIVFSEFTASCSWGICHSIFQ